MKWILQTLAVLCCITLMISCEYEFIEIAEPPPPEPGITVISNSGRDMPLEMVIMHEVGHNWFYGILGSNERAYPWMDEGINTFSEMRYMVSKYPDNRLYKMLTDNQNFAKLLGIEDNSYPTMHRISYLLNARRNLDIPIMSHTNEFADMNYGGIAYSKAGLCFYYLKEYLGEDLFNTIMQDYFETWKYKHPYPKDLQAIFEKHTDLDLAWFFGDILNTTKKVDYRIVKAKRDKVLVKNKGQIKAPVLVYERMTDNKVSSQWVPGFEGKQWLDLKNPGKTEKVQLFDEKIPELYSHNNYSSTKGLLRKLDPINLRLLGIIEKPGSSPINFLPAAGWNYYNRFMLGGMLYSNLVPLPKFEYQLVPLYSFGTGDLAGTGKIQYHLLPYSNLFQRISFYVAARQFAFRYDAPGSYYQKLSGGLNFRFTRKVNKNPVDNNLKLTYAYASDYTSLFSGNRSFNQYYQLEFDHTNKRKIDPYAFQLGFNGSDEFGKVSIEADYKHVYIYQNSLDVRFFGGAFLYRNNDLSGVYNFSTSGITGSNDYMFDNLYLARFEDPASKLAISNQFAVSDGGFSAYSPFGSSNEYMLAINISSSLPIDKNIPIQFYLNASTYGKTVKIADWESGDSFLYEGGVKLHLIKDVFEVYAPLFVADDIDKYLNEVTDNYFQRIRFTLQLNELNLFDKAREF